MLLPILFLFKTKISDYFKYSLISDYFKYSFFIRHVNMSFFNGFLLVTIPQYCAYFSYYKIKL